MRPSMRLLVFASLLLGALPAAEAKKPKGKLACTTTFQDGATVKVPSKRLRLEQPINCTLTATESDPTYVAQLQTHWKEIDDKGKMQKKVGQEHTGGVTTEKPLAITLDEGKDFSACVNFTIDARIVDEKGKASWKKTVKVSQFCPD